MMDGGWEDHLHFGFLGEHVLVAGLHIDSVSSFFVASLLTVVICVSERCATPREAQAMLPSLTADSES